MFRGLLGAELAYDSCSDSSESEDNVTRDKSLIVSVIQKIEAEQTRDLTLCRKRPLDKSSNFGTAQSKSKAEKSNISEASSSQAKSSLKTEKKFTPNIPAQVVDASSEKRSKEFKLEKALKRGNVSEAVVLTEQLAEQDFVEEAQKVAAAQEFLNKKEQAKRRKIRKRRQKLVWGFETKKRWETKSNM